MSQSKQVYGLIFADNKLVRITNEFQEFLTCLKGGQTAKMLMSPYTSRIYKDVDLLDVLDYLETALEDNTIKGTGNPVVFTLAGFSKLVDDKILEAWQGDELEAKQHIALHRSIVITRKAQRDY